jgi:hypothetical protein
VDGFAQPLRAATFLLFPILRGDGNRLAGVQPFEQQGVDALLALAFLVGPDQLSDIFADAAVSLSVTRSCTKCFINSGKVMFMVSINSPSSCSILSPLAAIVNKLLRAFMHTCTQSIGRIGVDNRLNFPLIANWAFPKLE